MSQMETSINQCFKELTDPRIIGRSQHYLSDILTIVLCAVVSGAEGFNDIEMFARCKESFFRTRANASKGMSLCKCSIGCFVHEICQLSHGNAL